VSTKGKKRLALKVTRRTAKDKPLETEKKRDTALRIVQSEMERPIKEPEFRSGEKIPALSRKRTKEF